MKTIEEIISNYDRYRGFLDDRFGRRFLSFLTREQAERIGYIPEEGCEWPEPAAWTKDAVLEQLKADVSFGFEKALNQRGISSSLMFDTVLKWNRILEDGLEDWDEEDYAMYGLPLFKATAEKYGWDNPIGEDTGREEYYNSESYYDSVGSDNDNEDEEEGEEE